MAKAAIEWLVTRADGKYLDGTAGGGGHLAVLLKGLGKKGRVLGLDRDPEALKEAGAITEGAGRLLLRRGSFGDLARLAEEADMLPLDGILLDLGVSSRQLDDPGKGFTYREDAPLDMRMDPDGEVTAADLIARSSEEELVHIFRKLGEIRGARGLARDIVTARESAPIERSGRLRELVELRTPANRHMKVLSQLFQALRMEVNDELGQLDKGLDASVEVLRPGGRLVVIAYHSLEDRRVKEYFRGFSGDCTCPKDFPVCVCGAVGLLRVLTRRVIKASQEEIAENPRARSARMRVAERTAEEKK